jgi:dihydroorotase
MKILIRHGRVVDPASGRDELADVAIAADRIVGIGGGPMRLRGRAHIDATGCIVAPGLVDLARGCASRATSTRACSRASWPPPRPAA